MVRDWTRREVLAGMAKVAGVSLLNLPIKLSASEPDTLDVAYAGSMASLMEGPVRSLAAAQIHLHLRGRAQGSNALAQLIVGGSISPDVFVAVTPGPMRMVLQAAKAEVAQPIARTEMVIAYSPKSRFANRFVQAGGVQNGEWISILQEPGFRFGRTDPSTDPQGRNIIFTMMLVEKLLRQPGLAERILGSTLNPQQIFSEPTMMARLQSGELDAASAYKIQPGPFHLPYLALPREINLSTENMGTSHPDVTLNVAGKTYAPEPLIYYAAVLKAGPNPKGAATLVEWLRGNAAQSIFRRYSYGPPGAATALRSQ